MEEVTLVDEQTAALLSRYPFQDMVSLPFAAELLGGPHRIPELMRLVALGEIFSWSHAAVEEHVISRTGPEIERPTIRPNLDDPARVLVSSEDIIFHWCAEYESRSQGKELAEKASVEDREKAIKRLALSGKWGVAAAGSASRLEISTKERNTLLKLVVGMAIGGYGYDPILSRSAIPKTIADDLAKANVPLDDDTVRKYLKEAARTVLPNSSGA